MRGHTGQLRFEITNLPYFDFNVQHSWGDGKFRRLEERLGKIISGLGAASMAIKKDREETVRREREWAEQARRKEEVRKYREEFNRKTKALNGLLLGWRESQEITEFLDVLVVEAEKQDLNDEGRRNVESLVEWAKTYSKMVNPLTRLQESAREFLIAPKQNEYQS
jgi:hypothetical protein